MRRTDIINSLIQKYGFKSYLEIGLDDTNNFRNVQCEQKESCDPYFLDASGSNGERICADAQGHLLPFIQECLTYRMTSDDMFKRINSYKKYDIIFIDGLHTEEQVAKDIVNGLKHLNRGGFIVVHDCLPATERAQMVPRVNGEWNGDVWKAISQLEKSGIEFNVVDTDYGCGVIKYKFNPTPIQKASWNYRDVFGDVSVRNKVMHVISEQEFSERYL